VVVGTTYVLEGAVESEADKQRAEAIVKAVLDSGKSGH
jgi:hypothetical protein